VRVALILLALSATTGCWNVRRAECDLLTRTTSSELEPIEQAVANLPDDPTAAATSLEAVAGRYTELGRKVGKLGFGTPQLQAQAMAYQPLADEAAVSTRRLAAALRARDATEQRSAEQVLGGVVARQKQLVEQVDGFCGR
jgi:hypothetical protein